jgi:hypothetical protein
MTVRSSRSSRRRTAASSSGAISNPAGSSSGKVGWDRTGASIAGSSIIVSAKFHVKHIPIAPTPGPPHCSCASRASDRSQLVTGLDPLPANARNSALTHARRNTAVPSSTVGTAPSRPNSEGMYTVKPASRTQRAKRATCGLMPGISVMTITPGPAPVTCTAFVAPSSVTVRRSKSSSGSSSSVMDVGMAGFVAVAWRRSL